MAIPWALKYDDRAIARYHDWVSANYTKYNKKLCLCNWFPLRILVEFAADYGLRVKLDYWRGSAPTGGGERKWNTTKELLLDSHNGQFNSKRMYRKRVESTVTARMIGTLNTQAVRLDAARPGDLILRDYNPRYWHVEVITVITGKVITTQAGSTPAIMPQNHVEKYPNGLAGESKIYGGSPRRWNFKEILSTR